MDARGSAHFACLRTRLLRGLDRSRMRSVSDRLIIELTTKRQDLLATLAQRQLLGEELPDVDEGLLPLDDIDFDPLR